MIVGLGLVIFFILFGLYLVVRTGWMALCRSARGVRESYRRNFRA